MYVLTWQISHKVLYEASFGELTPKEIRKPPVKNLPITIFCNICGNCLAEITWAEFEWDWVQYPHQCNAPMAAKSNTSGGNGRNKKIRM